MLFTSILLNVSCKFKNIYEFRRTEHQRAWSHMTRVLALSHIHIDDWFPHSAEVPECRPVSLDFLSINAERLYGNIAVIVLQFVQKEPDEHKFWSQWVWCMKIWGAHLTSPTVLWKLRERKCHFQTAVVTMFCRTNTKIYSELVYFDIWCLEQYMNSTNPTREKYKQFNLC